MYANIVHETVGGVSMYYFFSGATRSNQRRTNEKRRRNRSTMNRRRIQGIGFLGGIGGGGIRGGIVEGIRGGQIGEDATTNQWEE